MADIKTKDAVKGTIKTIDKAAIAGQRMKQAYVQTKEKAEHSTHAQENSAEQYAADRLEGGADRLTHEAAYQFDKQGRKGVEATKQNISKARDGIRQFKEKRAEEAMKNQSVRTPRNKGVKAVQETQKTVKQTARSSGKKTIKTVGKGSAKTAQKTVKTAEQTAKTSIKTTKQAAKAAQKTAQATAKAAQKAAQAAKATAKAVATGIKAAVKATIAAVKAIIAATKALIAAIAAGGWIGDVDIEGVTFNYEPGDAPKATAYKCDPWEEQYDIEYEYWEEMETNADGESVPVKFWYSDESKNNALAQDKKITTFEEGKTYMYSISLKAREGNTFATNSKVMVNGTNVNGANVSNTGTGLFVVAVRTIKPETLQWENISVVEINNAAISFNVGDKPVFTGKTPENVPYIYQTEFWSTDGGEKYYYSADFWNDNNPDDLFTEFESGKTYTYGIYFKAAEGYCFTTDTKLKINGKYYDYDTSDYDPMLQYPNGGYATMWVDTNLTITPTAAGDSDYKIIEGANGTWTQNSDGTLTFRANGDFSKFTGVKVDGTLIDAKNYTAVSGSTVITLKADYLKTLSGGTHKITVVYTDGECSANFEVKKAASEQTKPTEGDKADTTTPTGGKDTTSPQTGDNSNLALWFAVLFVSGAGALGTTVYSKRKKRME